ncbi:MAG: hypothetical protein KDA41_02610, partial [Planctomycetales bacterium]|nr:hypothetical protein [Planctomycetales bacterium]
MRKISAIVLLAAASAVGCRGGQPPDEPPPTSEPAVNPTHNSSESPASGAPATGAPSTGTPSTGAPSTTINVRPTFTGDRLLLAQLGDENAELRRDATDDLEQ